MFEIGTSLREARLRQGLELGRIEDETKIRAKYLQALEDERFDLLPAETYVKGFLRTYAEFLGLDGQLYVDEFNSRYATAEELPVSPRRTPQRRVRATESNFVAVALAGIVAITVLIVVAWQVGSSEPSQQTEVPGATDTRPATTGRGTTAKTGGHTAPARPTRAHLVVRATRGDCWLQVRAGSSTGPLLYEGTLQTGQSQPFTKKRLWIQFGAGDNVDVRLNGKRVQDFPSGSGAVIVTAKGVRDAQSA